MEIGPHPASLVDDLRRGEREAFERFFELYRLPVYNLVLALTHAGDETPSLVRDVFVTAYRQMLLSSGSLSLAPWTYRVAVATAEDYASDGGAEVAAGLAADGEAAAQWQDGDLPARFAQALDGLNMRQRAALVLTDVYGLRHDELAVVFGVSRDAVRSLLFRAREDFGRAFDELSATHGIPACRLAEQAAAASVGRAFDPDEERKLRQHAAYCRVCRPVVKSWPAGVAGLALFLKEAPLPAALMTAPVFATPIPVTLAETEMRPAAAAALVIPLDRALRGAGRALASRAAAAAVVVACLAATVGMALYMVGIGDGTSPADRTVSVTRQIPHGERGLGQGVAHPVREGRGGVARGEAARMVANSGHTVSTDAVAMLAGVGGTDWVSGGSDAGVVASGGGTSGGATPPPETAPPASGSGTGGDAASGDAKNSRGGGKANAGGNDKGGGKANAGGNGKANAGGNGKGGDKAKSGGGDAGSMGRANRPATDAARSSTATTRRQTSPSKAKALKPTTSKTKKQTRKPSNSQK